MSKTLFSDSCFVAFLLNCIVEDFLMYQCALLLTMLLSELFVLCHISALRHNAKRKEYEFKQFLKTPPTDQQLM